MQIDTNVDSYSEGLRDGFADGFREAMAMVEAGTDAAGLREWAEFYLNDEPKIAISVGFYRE